MNWEVMMKKLLIIVTIILTLILISCNVEPPEGNDPIDETKYGNVSPSSGKLGTKVRFFNMDSSDYPLDEYRILFNGMDELVVPDSLVDGDIYTSVPFSALHGPVKIVHYEVDSTDFSQDGILLPLINHDTINIPFFDVTEYSSRIDTRLTWFNLNYTITAAHSKYRSGKTIQEINWIGDVRGDTTTLTANYMIGDTQYSHLLQFYSIRGDNILPELMTVHSVKMYRKYGVDYVDHDYFGEGVVKLQTWQPGTMVSGRVITRLGNMNNFHFWCDFSD